MNKDIVFHVGSGDGMGAGDGSLSRPFRTIPDAQAAVREAIHNGHLGSITVLLAGGTYMLHEPLRFGCGDALGERCRVTYSSADGEEAILLGGTLLHAWEPWREGIWRTSIPPGMKFQTLYAEGERVTKARLPASGYYHTGEALGDASKGIRYRTGDVPELVDTAGLQVYVWPGEGEWNWFSETIPVRRVDAAHSWMTLARPCTWGIGEGSRYYLQGSLDFLREPGQFHLDEPNGMLYYYPIEGTPLTQRVVAPNMLRLLELEGADEQHPLSGLSFQGLTLACTDFYEDHKMMRSEPGMDNAEPDAHRHGLVYMRYASDIALTNCTIRESGSCGVFLDRCVERITLAGNRIERIGHTAVYASGHAPGEGAYRGAASAHLNQGHVVTNNIIVSGGELVGHGSGIVLYQCGSCDISHNQISHMPRYGISLKGQRYKGMPASLWGVPVTWENHWDFLYSRDNRIRFNDISEVMTDSQDGGMIEAWGIGRGNRIHGNRLHHSGIHFSFGFGIYLDDASDQVEVTHNMLDHLYSTGEGKLWMAIFSKGIGNRIANNLIVDNPDAVSAIGSQEMVGEENRDITVETNIVANSGLLYFFVNWRPDRYLMADRNLFWQGGAPCRVAGELPLPPAGSNDVRGNNYDWEAWRSLLDGQYDGSSLTAPPAFVNGQAGDYRLLPSSPAYALGWEDIDFSLMGLQYPVR